MDQREPRVPVSLAVKLAYGSVQEFIERHALNLSSGGIFIRTRDPKPEGTLVAFSIHLADGKAIIRGKGVVRWSTPPSGPGEPPRAPGMGVRFTELDVASRALVNQICAARGPDAQSPEPPRPPDASAPLMSAEAKKAANAGWTKMASSAGMAPVKDAAAAAAPAAQRGGRSKRVLGIDLGTTNSCVAIAENGKARVLASRQGWRTLPSIVAYDAQGRLLVGQPAKQQMIINPKNTVYGSKRLVGRPFASPTVQACRDRFHYEIVPGPRGEAAVRFAGRDFSLQQVAAFILSEIRDVATQALGEDVDRAIITVPAYYNDHQRQAVREAGLLAGLHVERIVNEPTAAALAFGYGKNLDTRVLVFDLGGGTFDASILEIQGDVYEVVSTGGDTFLGGVDFDNQLVDHLVQRFAEQHGFNVPQDRIVWQRIRDAAEELKVALSERERAVAKAPYLCKDPAGKDVGLEVEVSRAELVELTERLVDRAVAVCREVLQAKGLSASELGEVLLVGGQSRMPLVWDKIRKELGKEPNKSVHPDEAVAIGAALLADSEGKIDSVVLIDVLPMTIGIAMPGGKMAPVLARNAKLPARRAWEIATSVDGQTAFELAVFQGDSAKAAECEYLGSVRVDGLPAQAKGQVRVAVEFAVGVEGILDITAKNLVSGQIIAANFSTLEGIERVRQHLQIPEQAAAPRGARPLDAADLKAAAKQVPAAVAAQAQGEKAGLFGKFFGKK